MIYRPRPTQSQALQPQVQITKRQPQRIKKRWNMKKILGLAAVLLLLFVFMGSCGSENEDKVDNSFSEEFIERTQQETEFSKTLRTYTAKPTQAPTQLPTPQPTEYTVTPTENSTFKIGFLDVGQADAAVVECDGQYMLIDGGNKADSSKIYAFLKKYSINHLDIVVATHAHEDHVGGIPGALNYANADLVLSPVEYYDSDAFTDFVKYANQNGQGIKIPSIGDTYRLGSSTVTILGLNAGSEVNDSSIVLMVKYGNTSFLFTGDAEREAEQAILNSGVDLSANVLKVGHHGSDTSTTYPFLREIMPKYAVISVGANNSYEHPTDNTLSRLRDADVTVYRTDLHGNILITSDGETVSVSTEKSATTEDVMAPGGRLATPQPAIYSEPEELDEPDGVDYIANKNTKKFHYPSCNSVKKMKESNKWYFTGTRDELLAKGYDSCGNCHP